MRQTRATFHSKKKPCDFSLDTIIKSSSTAPTVCRSILLSQTQELILVHQVRSLASSVLPGGCQLAQLCHRQMASRLLAQARMNTSRNLMPATPNLSFSQINPSQRESIMLIPDPRLLPDIARCEKLIVVRTAVVKVQPVTIPRSGFEENGTTRRACSWSNQGL